MLAWAGRGRKHGLRGRGLTLCMHGPAGQTHAACMREWCRVMSYGWGILGNWHIHRQWVANLTQVRLSYQRLHIYVKFQRQSCVSQCYITGVPHGAVTHETTECCCAGMPPGVTAARSPSPRSARWCLTPSSESEGVEVRYGSAVDICRVWTWRCGSEALENVWICKVVREPELRKCILLSREVFAQEEYR